MKLYLTLLLIGLILSDLFNRLKPQQPRWRYISFDKIKVGDTIKVNVGFDTFKTKGTVTSKYSDYLWCEILNIKGEVYHNFTASKSYGNFEILK